MKNFDLIIAGADCAGSTVANLVGKAGYSALLIDKKPENALGRPWYDAVYPYVFSLIDMKPFGIKRNDIKTKIISPNEKISGIVTGGGDYLIHRRELTEKLTDLIKQMENIVFKDRCQVIRPILKNNDVVGVVVREAGALKEYYSKITIDSTGINSVLREQMPPETGIDSSSLEDYELAVTTKQSRKKSTEYSVNESYFGVFGGLNGIARLRRTNMLNFRGRPLERMAQKVITCQGIWAIG